jgi:hypothetical protein
MLFNFFISSLIVAGISVLWRGIRTRHKAVRIFFKKQCGFYAPAILCGTCFTYWSALLLILIANPLANWHMPIAGYVPFQLAAFITFFACWMALGFSALFLRFALVLMNETVDHFTHNLNPRGGHGHNNQTP